MIISPQAVFSSCWSVGKDGGSVNLEPVGSLSCSVELCMSLLPKL